MPSRRKARVPSALLCAIAALVTVVALTAVPISGQGQAGSLGLTPTSFDVPEAQPGETYTLVAHLQHQYDTQGTLTVDVSGPDTAWVEVQPGTGTALPARSTLDVTVRLKVPANAPPGPHEPTITFYRDPEDTPGQTQVRTGVALPIHAIVGGEAHPHVAWGTAVATDAQEGGAIHVRVGLENDGNVRATTRLHAAAYPVGLGAQLANDADGEATLDPGTAGNVTVDVPGLAVGQYRIELSSTDWGGFHANVTAKVTPFGTVAPSGALVAIEHAPRAAAGETLRVEARFRNDGTVPIRVAQFHGEVRQGGRLVAPLESEALAIPVGNETLLVAYWEVAGAGTFDIVGHVTYDGYVTPDATSFVAVEDGGGAGLLPLLILLGVLVAVLAVAAVLLARRRPPASGKAPGAGGPGSSRRAQGSLGRTERRSPPPRR